MTIHSEFEGLGDALQYFKTFPQQASRAAALAINQTLQRQGLKLIQHDMYEQVGFPRGYLNGDRLGVSQLASAGNLEGVIRARKRATSLARFAQPGTPVGSKAQTGITVRVRNGNSTYLRGAWLVRLKKGASKTEDNFNIGLAVRVKQGDRIAGKSSEHRSWLVPGRVALLYGPSVDQVFRDVAEDTGPEILKMVSTEFLRQLNRLT